MPPRVKSIRNFRHYPNNVTSYFKNDKVIKMTTNNQLRFPLLLMALVAFIAVPLAAQSPNTASMIVAVTDQTGAVVQDAKVSVLNTATGAVREVLSGSDGSATIPALALTGTYTVIVSKEGFGVEELTDISLRSGETATLKVKLLVGREGGSHGLRHRRRCARRSAARPPALSPEIDETPILGRKVSTLPLLNSAFRQGKGTGDLFVNSTYFVTGVGSRRADHVHARRREQRRGVGPPDVGRHDSDRRRPGDGGALELVLGRVRLDLRRRDQHRHQVGHERSARRWRCSCSVPGDWQAKSFSTDNFCPPSVSSCVTPATLGSISPVDIPDTLNQGSVSIGGPIVKDKTFFFVAADYTAPGSNDLTLEHAAGVRAAGGRQPRIHGALPPDARQRAAGPEPHPEPEPDVPFQRRPVLRRQPPGRRGRHERAERRPQVFAAGPGRPSSTTRRCSPRPS